MDSATNCPLLGTTFSLRVATRKYVAMITTESTTSTIGLVTLPKIGGKMKLSAPGGSKIAPSANTSAPTGLLPVLPAGVHSAGGIVTIWT